MECLIIDAIHWRVIFDPVGPVMRGVWRKSPPWKFSSKCMLGICNNVSSGLTTVDHIQISVLNFLWVFNSYRTLVHLTQDSVSPEVRCSQLDGQNLQGNVEMLCLFILKNKKQFEIWSQVEIRGEYGQFSSGVEKWYDWDCFSSSLFW